MNAEVFEFEMMPMALADLEQVVANEVASHDHPWTFNNFYDSINSGYWSYVITDKTQNRTILGHCVFMPGVDELHLLNITVLPKYRRLQIANRVLRTIEPIALDNQMIKIFLEVRISNLAAISLYEHLGYSEVSRRKEYYRAGIDQNGSLLREDAIIMVKDLN